MDALVDAVMVHLGDAQKLDAIAQFLGIVDIHRRDLGYALGINSGEIDSRAKRHRRQQGQLVGRVHAVDIEGRVGLGIAKLLRLGQHVGEIAAGLAHGGQDIVAGAVQDAVQAGDPVAGQPLAQRPDNRDAAGHRGLISQRYASGLGLCRQIGAVMGQQRFVSGDYVAAGLEGGFAHRLGRAVAAADQFHHHVGVGRARHSDGIVEPLEAGYIHAPVEVAVARRDRGDLQRPARPQGQQLGLFAEQFQRARADRSQAGYGDFQWFRHPLAAFPDCGAWPPCRAAISRLMRWNSSIMSLYPCAPRNPRPRGRRLFSASRGR